ncbi:MAG: hypothetical protein AB1508_12645 [Pseudomonadota bacterium]
MNKRSQARLTGVIRLTDVPHSIGIPVFQAPRANCAFIPETDTRLKITRFTEFYNEAGYNMLQSPSGLPSNDSYSIGDSAPVPFWLNGQLRVIASDTEEFDLLKLGTMDDAGTKFFDHLVSLLMSARRGELSDRMERWSAEDHISSYADVYLQAPDKSKYWISRYRVALANSRKSASPKAPIFEQLRRVADTWFERFALKSDYGRMRIMLGQASDEIYTDREIKAYLFAFCLNQWANKSFAQLERACSKDKDFYSDFPNGLYYEMRYNVVPPSAPFKYVVPRDILSDFLAILSRSRETQDFSNAVRLARILFGKFDCPRSLDDFLRDTQQSIFAHYQNASELEQSLSPRRNMSEWLSAARLVVRFFDIMCDIDAVQYGDRRFAKEKPDLFAIDVEYIENLRRHIRRV